MCALIVDCCKKSLCYERYSDICLLWPRRYQLIDWWDISYGWTRNEILQVILLHSLWERLDLCEMQISRQACCSQSDPIPSKRVATISCERISLGSQSWSCESSANHNYDIQLANQNGHLKNLRENCSRIREWILQLLSQAEGSTLSSLSSSLTTSESHSHLPIDYALDFAHRNGDEDIV